MLEDRWLVMRLRGGSTEAFDRIYRKYRRDLLALAMSLARDRAGAEDALHDAFVGLARRAPQLRPQMNLRGYLSTSVANRVRNQYRDRARVDLVDTPPEPEGPPGPSPADRTMAADDLCRVERALEALPADQREVIVLHLLHGLRFREIAAGLEVSINTVQSRYRYGVAKLRATVPEETHHEIAPTH